MKDAPPAAGHDVSAMTDVYRQFSDAMRRLGFCGGERVALAVSGGGDSMALALLARAWARENGGEVLALTVDHGLRPEAVQEALDAGKALQAHGVPHRILKWMPEAKPESHIQERAREARYRLLQEECAREGICFLATAHNAEDQIETFWMRLSHGSGLDGLAGMAAKRMLSEDLALIRPVLGFSREVLRGYCRGKGMQWAEDPSNRDARYLRARLRQVEDVLAAEGLSPSRLSATLQKLEDARAALAFYTEGAFSDAVTFHEEGYLALTPEILRDHPVDIRRRVLVKALSLFSAGAYPPEAAALELLRLDLESEDFTGRTLCGCEIFPSGGRIVFCREDAAAEKRREVRDGLVWDGRFTLSGFAEATAEIGILGEKGLAFLRKEAPETLPEQLPFKIKKTLPALWRGEKPVAVPHLSWYAAEASALERGRLVAWPGVKIV